MRRRPKRYVRALVADIKALRLRALRYLIYNQVYPGLRRKRRTMHPIYYLAFEDSVEILRVMHVQRDPGLQLRRDTWICANNWDTQ